MGGISDEENRGRLVNGPGKIGKLLIVFTLQRSLFYLNSLAGLYVYTVSSGLSYRYFQVQDVLLTGLELQLYNDVCTCVHRRV